MLSAMLKNRAAAHEQFRETQDVKKAQVVNAANELTQALVEHLNVGVAQSYLNQKRLDVEAKQLHNGATNFSQQTQQWLELIEKFCGILKEIGDVENWAVSIEGDVMQVTQALEYTYKTYREPSC